MGGPKVQKLPFEEDTTESQTPTDPFGYLKAAADFEPNLDILDAATQSEYDQATDANNRQMDSVYAEGLPQTYRLGSKKNFARQLGQTRGVAMAAGQEGLSRVKLAQKLGVAGLGMGRTSTGRRSGYQSGIQPGNGALGAGISGGAGILSAAITAGVF